ncbi:DJ-1/PfpI family protein [Massilia sp. W12]|uniref:DJ-1/PfpI family protein n=1 Tax=Massilia sp. W12 TaxID=3126507 RepID=UPI0030D236B5
MSNSFPANTYPRTLQIGILVFEDFEPLDVWGFIEAFSIARFLGTGYVSDAPRPFTTRLIANQDQPGKLTPPCVASYNAPRVLSDLWRDEALNENFDLIMVPGGYGVNRIFDDAAELAATLDWLRKIAAKTPLTASVCTGAALYAAAGLLDGLPATSNQSALSWVAAQGPGVLWDNVARWVDAGRHVSSAGVSAGADLGFYLVQRLGGRAMAEIAALTAEYHWQRDPLQPIPYPQQATISVPLPK